MRRLSPLTPEEQEYATDQHDLVDKFLRVKRLPRADYYDIVVFGFLEAVQTWFRAPGYPEKWNFAAFSFICMRHAVGEDWKYRKRLMRHGDPLSLDGVGTNSEDMFSRYPVIPDSRQNTEKQVVDQDLIDRLLDVATPQERRAVELTCRGYSPKEISEILGIARDTGRRTLYHFRRKAKAVQEERGVIKCPYYEKYRDQVRAKQQVYRASQKAGALQAAVS